MSETLTPMLEQYKQLKAKYQDCILFFRLGDFYEMFYQDAKTASPILEVVLTCRDAGKSGRIPMCGIPYHAKDVYIAKLIRAGLKVAICEQIEDPALAKGLVKRDIVRVITTGTFIDEGSAEARYILSLNTPDKETGFALIDSTGGTLLLNQYPGTKIIGELFSKLPIHECIFPENYSQQLKELFSRHKLRNNKITLSPLPDWYYNFEIAQKNILEHFGVQTLKGFAIDENKNSAVSSAGALLEYTRSMNCQPMRHIDKIALYDDEEYAFISPAAIYGLGLEDLFQAIDRTRTTIGKRCLKNWLTHPLKDKDLIIHRQDAVKILKNQPALQRELAHSLAGILDIDRILTRISCRDAAARDLLTLRASLEHIPDIQKIIVNLGANNSNFSIDDIGNLRTMLANAINPQAEAADTEGGLIKEGFNLELDNLRRLQNDRKLWLKNLQAQEIKRTGINSLKIGYNHVFGYYIEITRSNLHLAPQNYTRKQTLANAERFVTAELKDFEEQILCARETILNIEKEIIRQLHTLILDNSVALHNFSRQISRLDAIYSLSILALSPDYCAPEISQDNTISIQAGRHPVVERLSNTTFIPNDTLLDCQDNHLLILTGPNMSGKSTYIRQTAILVILAQIGSFIPAESAVIGIVDKIFTRIGSHDEISKGQSTFMVEMSETAGILNNLSTQSLVILDEIGRGTSTYDGLSLAWATAVYLQKQKVRTIFATHFHELTALANKDNGVKNYNVAVKEWNDEVIFLHKIIPGGSDESYGIYVAKIAGIPEAVITHARQILGKLELGGGLNEKINAGKITGQLEIFTQRPDNQSAAITAEIASLDADKITPLYALQKINEWKKKIDAAK